MREFINGRPLTVVGLFTALHSIVYGIGFIFLFGGFEETALYENVNRDANAAWLGWTVLVAGLLVAAGLVLRKDKLVSLFSALQSLAWGFVFFIYFFNDQALLGVGTALVWAALSSYVAYVHANLEVVLGTALKLYKNNQL